MREYIPSILNLFELAEFILNENVNKSSQNSNSISSLFNIKFHKLYQNLLKDLEINNFSSDVEAYGDKILKINLTEYSKFYNKHSCSCYCYLHFLKNISDKEYSRLDFLANELSNNVVFMCFFKKVNVSGLIII